MQINRLSCAVYMVNTLFTAPPVHAIRMIAAHLQESAMDVHTRHAQVQLHAQRPMSLIDAQGTRLRATRGTAWLTIDDDLRDLVLSPGEEWIVDSSHRVLVTPLGRDAVELELSEADSAPETIRPSEPSTSAWFDRMTRALHLRTAGPTQAWA